MEVEFCFVYFLMLNFFNHFNTQVVDLARGAIETALFLRFEEEQSCPNLNVLWEVFPKWNSGCGKGNLREWEVGEGWSIFDLSSVEVHCLREVYLRPSRSYARKYFIQKRKNTMKKHWLAASLPSYSKGYLHFCLVGFLILCWFSILNEFPNL